VTCLTSHAGTAAIIWLLHKTQLMKSYRSARWPHYLRGAEMVARVLELARAGARATEIVRKLTAEGRRFTHHGLNFCRLRCRCAIGSARGLGGAGHAGHPSPVKLARNSQRTKVETESVQCESGLVPVSGL
jgi:hypothetical protein